MLEMIFECVSPDKEHTEDQDNGEKAEAKPDPFCHGKTPPALIQPMRRMHPFLCHRSSIQT